MQRSAKLTVKCMTLNSLCRLPQKFPPTPVKSMTNIFATWISRPSSSYSQWALDIHSPLTLDVDIVPSWPMHMWAGVVHTQVQHNTGCACVRPTSNACTVGPERPPSCNFARASPVVHPRHSVNMWMWSSPRRAGDSDGHYYCIVEDGGEGKENQKRREWEKRWRNQQQRVAGRDLMPGVQGQSQ